MRLCLVVACLLFAGAAHAQGGKGKGAKGGAAAAGEDVVPMSAIDKHVFSGIGRPQGANPQDARDRGMVPTGLTPRFDPAVHCPDIDEGWAIDYSGVRGREAMHGGIDIPAPTGTPLLAIAAGEVVAKFLQDESAQGIQIWLRHAPADTGLPMWVYSQYTHLVELPELALGTRVALGAVIGKTGNSGISGLEARQGVPVQGRKAQQFNQERRPAVHFAIVYSDSKQYYLDERRIVPQDGFWMDPVALYRNAPPFESAVLKALPPGDKRVAIPYMLPDGTRVPANTRLIWPYACSKDPLPPARRNARSR